MYINVLEGLHFFIPAVRISPPPWLHFSRADESGQTIFLVGFAAIANRIENLSISFNNQLQPTIAHHTQQQHHHHQK